MGILVAGVSLGIRSKPNFCGSTRFRGFLSLPYNYSLYSLDLMHKGENRRLRFLRVVLKSLAVLELCGELTGTGTLCVLRGRSPPANLDGTGKRWPHAPATLRKSEKTRKCLESGLCLYASFSFAKICWCISCG